MRKLASIQKVEEVQPIEGADKIEKVRINAWWVVAPKGQMKQGDLVVYYEVDSFLPNIEKYSFLLKGSTPKKMLIDGVEKEGIRLKTIRLRGQISQGLVLPLDGIDCVKDVGTDISELLGVIKWEQPISASLAGQVKGSFPAFLHKTDEERVQNIPDVIAHHAGKNGFYVSEKLDGSSATFYKKDGELGVCSRNLELKRTDGNTLWVIADEYNLQTVIPEGYAIQGEIIGVGIQGNPLKLSKHELFVFNVYDFISGRFLNLSEFQMFCHDNKLKSVPIINAEYTIPDSVDEILKYAEGESALNDSSEREGIVIRPVVESRETIGGLQDARFSFKAISNKYLLDERDS